MKIKKSQLKILVRKIITETLQRLDESQRGEWWIYPGGNSQFADGDIGESGHEGYAIEHIAREIYEHFGGDAPDQMGYLGDFEDSILQSLVADERMTEDDMAVWENRGSKGGPIKIIIDKLIEDKAYQTPEQTNDAVYIAYGSNRLDARDYAMKYLGWKRMTTTGGWGTEVQTWFLRQSDLNDIKRGIYDAWGDNGEEDAEDTNHEVSIEVRANNKVFSGIPMNVLDTATVSDIVTYQRGAVDMRERKTAPVMDPVNFTSMG